MQNENDVTTINAMVATRASSGALVLIISSHSF